MKAAQISMRFHYLPLRRYWIVNNTGKYETFLFLSLQKQWSKIKSRLTFH